MRLNRVIGYCTSLALIVAAATTALAQQAEPEPDTRQTTIAAATAEKSQSLHPYDVTISE